MSRLGIWTHTLCWSETQEFEFVALNRSAMALPNNDHCRQHLWFNSHMVVFFACNTELFKVCSIVNRRSEMIHRLLEILLVYYNFSLNEGIHRKEFYDMSFSKGQVWGNGLLDFVLTPSVVLSLWLVRIILPRCLSGSPFTLLIKSLMWVPYHVHQCVQLVSTKSAPQGVDNTAIWLVVALRRFAEIDIAQFC